MKYIASCSFGKDSLATIILAVAYGYPIDAAVYAEKMAAYLCKWQGLYSPVYDYSNRGGCFFCPNQKEKELYHLYNHHPGLWDELLKLSAVENKVRDRFTRNETLEEIDKKFRRLHNETH